jgi:pimeloyl-ACP methyl ester carboxylesterase
MASKTDQTLRLKDGRQVGFSEYGDLEGRPIFFFHGMPGSRLQGGMIEGVAAQLGARLVAPDRPGSGLSDFMPERKLLDYPQDVLALADHLGLSSFGVMGASGGGPYVSACAYQFPERLAAVGILAGGGPMSEPGATEGMMPGNVRLFTISQRYPWLLKLFLRLQFRGDMEKRLPKLLDSLPEPDKIVLAERKDLVAIFLADFKEALRPGLDGLVQEIVLTSRPWGFSLADLRKKVYLWQGEQDRNVPPAMGHYQARTIPDCEATFYPEDGHLSLIANHMQEILAKMLA